jgi:hypothetical protein
MTELTTSIGVFYKHADGWHVFTCKELPGLYIASKDAELAYNDVPVAIEKLLELDFGVKCKAVPELSFAEFVKAQVKAQQQRAASRGQRPHRQHEDDNDDAIPYPVLTTQRYAVLPAQTCNA